ncbi:hypothetical protein T06_1512 [Trichinella sp. T6]|nr:hypothetical protein T06_1512 [Trichinella sp. T6]
MIHALNMNFVKTEEVAPTLVWITHAYVQKIFMAKIVQMSKLYAYICFISALYSQSSE